MCRVTSQRGLSEAILIYKGQTKSNMTARITLGDKKQNCTRQSATTTSHDVLI